MLVKSYFRLSCPQELFHTVAKVASPYSFFTCSLFTGMDMGIHFQKITTGFIYNKSNKRKFCMITANCM